MRRRAIILLGLPGSGSEALGEMLSALLEIPLCSFQDGARQSPGHLAALSHPSEMDGVI
jgi:hypothetical protein